MLSLALGVGANSAIFQLVDAVRLRSAAGGESAGTGDHRLRQELVALRQLVDAQRAADLRLWDQVHGLTEPFSATIAWSATRFNLAQGGEARYAEGQYVSGDFFRVLGVQPWIGRTFTAEDDRAGCGTPGAVVSYAFWQRELGGDPSGAWVASFRSTAGAFP